MRATSDCICLPIVTKWQIERQCLICNMIVASLQSFAILFMLNVAFVLLVLILDYLVQLPFLWILGY